MNVLPLPDASPRDSHFLYNSSRHSGRDDTARRIYPQQNTIPPHGTHFPSRTHSFFPIKCDLAHIIRLFSQLSLRAVVEKTIFFADKNILGTFYE